MTTILERYQELHPTSASLHAQAREMFPDGVTHDTRRVTPFPIYVDYAQGSRKWDVDGNELIDYVMGHGALLLGHGHPKVMAAAAAQLHKGTHVGASHRLEIEWAGWVKRLIPSVERVRFTSSGTEATHMAIRLARAFTGRDKIIKFEHHFHGWHDNVVGAPDPEGGIPRWPGVPGATLSNLIIIPDNDVPLLAKTLAENHDVAAVILEPTGASWGTLPTRPDFLSALRELTRQHGVLLIFDEVVTGFRVSPGGAQAYYNIRPDITCLAKILSGGLPGGAVAGRADILSLIEFRDDPQWDSSRRIPHPGTFNANPLSAAAGVAALSVVAEGKANAHADAAARRLIEGMNLVLDERNAPGCVYGLASQFHILLGVDVGRPVDSIEWPWQNGAGVPGRTPAPLAIALKRGMINNGVDLMGTGGHVSSVHDLDDIDRTVEAFARTIAQMQKEGLLPQK